MRLGSSQMEGRLIHFLGKRVLALTRAHGSLRVYVRVFRTCVQHIVLMRKQQSNFTGGSIEVLGSVT